MTMNRQSAIPPDLLEQAHLAFLRGNLAEARSLLDSLVLAEPNNAPAEDLRATVIGKQAALSETARLEADDAFGAAPQAQTGSIWTRPIPDPTTALLNSPTARKWPKPVLLAFCLLSGIVIVLLPGRHHSSLHSHWYMDVAFGLVLGSGLFIWMLLRKR